jgi:uncharacterized protein (TIGR00369 family)
MKAHDEKLTPLAHTAHNRCFGCGPANPAGLHLEFMLADDLHVVCLVSIPDTFEGPRGFLHGGIIATLLDETMSKAVRAHNIVGMTRHMEVDYRHPVPSSMQIRLEGRVYHHEGRKHWAEANIMDEAGRVLAHSKGLFIEVRPRQERVALAGEPTPHG